MMYLSVSVVYEVYILPWTIIQQVDDISFSSLFREIQSGAIGTIVPTQELMDSSLEKVYVGHSKEEFNIVEVTHSVIGVCGIFGSYIKFVVNLPKDLNCVMVEKRPRISTNDNSRSLPPVISEKNRKDSLYNAIIKFCRDQGLNWSDPSRFGKQFITDLCNLLWYIDGHHTVLSSRSCSVPSYFSSFVGFNRPELSKHRKRSISNMNKDKLLELSTALHEHVSSSWMQLPEWAIFKEALHMLIMSVSSYAAYLDVRNKSMKIHHDSPEPSVNFSDSSAVRSIPSRELISPMLSEVDSALLASIPFQRINVLEYAPTDKRQKYVFIRELEKGLSCPMFFFTYSHGSNVGNYYYLWKAPSQSSEADSIVCSSENLRIIDQIKSEIPIFHTRMMRREFYQMYGRISPHSKPYILRSIYQSLTHDCTSARTTAEEEVDQRVTEALMMEDADIVIDLREVNCNGKDRYAIFWKECSHFLSSCTAVHERRHDQVTYMAKAISIRDLIEQVQSKCPENTPIPSEAWVRLNFCPRNPRSKASKRYTGRLEAKHMIQKRQFRKYHPDSHFCAALFRYMRDYAIKFRNISLFVCIDDKHRIKVGEPNYPVAAVERGREVIVSSHESMQVGDHDFCRFSLIPSVVLINDIPETVEGSWYRGQVIIGIKEAAFEPSSPIRHATELHRCLASRMESRHILFLYADGGPDHRLTYLTVQLSLIALYLTLNLDVLIAGRTAPSHSWANPVERIMSIINLGMQCIGIMRSKVSDDVEKVFEKCRSLKEIRDKCCELKQEVLQSIAPAKDLIASVLKRLELKEKKFDVYSSATEEEVQSFWNVLLTVDSLLTTSDTAQACLSKRPSLVKFIEHCCTFRKYSVTIKKCGKEDCSLCAPVKMSMDLFKEIHELPNPILDDDGHYKPFDAVYGTTHSVSEGTPLLPSETARKKTKSISFNVTQQHVRNVGLLVQCDECEMWRLLFSKCKLSPAAVGQLKALLEDMSYSCGASFEDLDMPQDLKSVCVKIHKCFDPMEKLYYSCGFEVICFYCGKEVPVIDDDSDYYPQCDQCSSHGKPFVRKPRRRSKK